MSWFCYIDRLAIGEKWTQHSDAEDVSDGLYKSSVRKHDLEVNTYYFKKRQLHYYTIDTLLILNKYMAQDVRDKMVRGT